MTKMKTIGFQFSQLTVLHIEFVGFLLEERVISASVGLELITDGLKGLPPEAKNVILPLNEEMMHLIYTHIKSGRRKIAIYRDGNGERYVAGNFLEDNNDNHKDNPPYKQLYLPFDDNPK